MKNSDARTMDLTQGDITSQIFYFSLPILVGYIFQTLYNNVDSLVVGNFVGKEALAAVNTCTPVYNLLVGFFIGMSTGTSVVLSRSLTSNDCETLKKALHTTVGLALMMGAALGACGVALIDAIVKLLNCQPDIAQMTAEYLRIYIAGILFTAFYNVGAAVLRSVGDSRSPFYALVAGCAANIVLDLVFVAVFRWGVSGAAIATVLSQALSVVLVFRRMMKLDVKYRFSFREMKVHRELVPEIMANGFPAGVQSALISVSNLVLNRYINGFSSDLMAGIGVAQKVDRFISMPTMALGLAITTFVSQNVGANKAERIRQGLRASNVMCAVFVALAGGLLFPVSEQVMRLFNRDPGVVRYGSLMMRWLIPFYILQGEQSVYSGVLRGFGRSRAVMLLSLAGMVGIRQLYLYVFSRVFWNEYVIYIAYPVGWFFSFLGVFVYFEILKNKKKIPV